MASLPCTTLLALLIIITCGALNDVGAASYAVESNPQLAEMQRKEERHEAGIRKINQKHEARDRRFRELLQQAVQKAEKADAARNAKQRKMGR